MSLYGPVALITCVAYYGALTSGCSCSLCISPPSTPRGAWRGGVARTLYRRCMGLSPLSPGKGVGDCLFLSAASFPRPPPRSAWRGGVAWFAGSRCVDLWSCVAWYGSGTTVRTRLLCLSSLYPPGHGGVESTGVLDCAGWGCRPSSHALAASCAGCWLFLAFPSRLPPTPGEGGAPGLVNNAAWNCRLCHHFHPRCQLRLRQSTRRLRSYAPRRRRSVSPLLRTA